MRDNTPLGIRGSVAEARRLRDAKRKLKAAARLPGMRPCYPGAGILQRERPRRVRTFLPIPLLFGIRGALASHRFNKGTAPRPRRRAKGAPAIAETGRTPRRSRWEGGGGGRKRVQTKQQQGGRLSFLDFSAFLSRLFARACPPSSLLPFVAVESASVADVFRLTTYGDRTAWSRGDKRKPKQRGKKNPAVLIFFFTDGLSKDGFSWCAF